MSVGVTRCWGMADDRRTAASRVKGLAGAPGFSLRSFMLVSSLVGLGFAVWSAATGSLGGLLAGLAGFVLLLALGVVAQLVAERSGALERERVREEELQAEMAAWPGWKRVAFLVLAALIGIGVILLRIWSEGFRPD